jgi:hypothetical protein
LEVPIRASHRSVEARYRAVTSEQPAVEKMRVEATHLPFWSIASFAVAWNVTLWIMAAAFRLHGDHQVVGWAIEVPWFHPTVRDTGVPKHVKRTALVVATLLAIVAPHSRRRFPHA